MRKRKNEVETNNFFEITQKMLVLVGKNNFEKVTNCFSRLRFSIKDLSLVQTEKLQELELVKGVTWSGNELQVIFGPIAIKIRELVESIVINQDDIDFELKQQPKSNSKQGFWKRFLGAANGIVVPILPVLLTSGMIGAISAILISTGLIQDGPAPDPNDGPVYVTNMNWYSGLVYIANNSGIALLSVFFCYSTVKYFKGDGMMGIFLGLVITSRFFLTSFFDYPGEWNLFKIGQDALGEDIWISIKGYNNSIIPAVGSGLLYVGIDRFIKKWMPTSIDMIFRPFLAFVTVFIISFLFLLPLLEIIQLGVNETAKAFYAIPYRIGGALAGLLYLPLNLSGFGWPVGFALEADFYSDAHGPLKIVPLWDAVTLGYLGTMLALYLKQAKLKDKTNDLATSPPLFVGVMEPAMYGVLIQKPKAFWLTNLGSAVVGIMMDHVTKNQVGGYGILGIIGFGTDYQAIGLFLGSALVGFIINFLLIFFLWNEKESEMKLVKKSLRSFANHVWVLNLKSKEKVKLIELRKELHSIQDQVKLCEKLNEEFYKLYLKEQRLLNRLTIKEQKTKLKETKYKNQIQTLIFENKPTTFWEEKLVGLEKTHLKLETQAQTYQEVKTQLDLRAMELKAANKLVCDRVTKDLNDFFQQYEVKADQEKMFNQFWNSLNDNLIVSGYLESKIDQITKAEFYQIENKMVLKLLPKRF